MEFKINSEFDFGDKVQLSFSQNEVGMVTQFKLMPNALIMYLVTWGHGATTQHYDFELKKLEISI